jgi:hypothetical protein
VLQLALAAQHCHAQLGGHNQLVSLEQALQACGDSNM